MNARPLAIFIPPLLGVALLLGLTPQGIGVTPDAVEYLSAAKNLANGNGLTVSDYRGNLVPLTHFPPLTSILIAIPTRLGAPLLTSALLLNVLFIAGSLLTLALLIRRATNSLLAPLFGSLLLLCYPDFLALHAIAGSEAPFFFFSLLTILLLSQSLAQNSLAKIILAACAAALASLTRYPGAVLILAAAPAIFLNPASTAPRSQRLRHALAFLFIAIIPAAIALLRNNAEAGTLTDRAIAFHRPNRIQLHELRLTITGWFLPRDLPFINRKLVALPLLIAMAAAIDLAFRKPRDPRPPFPPLVRFLLIYLLAYPLFILATILLFDAATRLEPRILLPEFIPFLILASITLERVIRDHHHSWMARTAVTCLSIILIADALGLERWTRHELSDRPWNQTALCFNSPAWKNSALVQTAAQVDPRIKIYSNLADALSFTLNREVFELPASRNETSRLPNPDFNQQLEKILAEVRQGRAVIAYSNQHLQDGVPSLDDLAQQLSPSPALITFGPNLSTAISLSAPPSPPPQIPNQDSVDAFIQTPATTPSP